MTLGRYTTESDAHKEIGDGKGNVCGRLRNRTGPGVLGLEFSEFQEFGAESLPFHHPATPSNLRNLKR